jgi:hypothetical protein
VLQNSKDYKNTKDFENKVMQHDNVISFIGVNQKRGQSDKKIIKYQQDNALSPEEKLEDLQLLPK